MSHDVLSLRDQSDLLDQRLNDRLSTIVPEIMERAGIDCWVLVAREYNEDPVLKTMLPATWLSARRRTILVFTSFGKERVAIARYGVGTAFPAAWSPDQEPDQWRRLADYLDEHNPARIAINQSATFAVADGMTTTEAASFFESLPDRLNERVVDGDALAVGWLEARTPDEAESYSDLCSRAHGLLRRALSPEVITPEVTTTDDVEWWLRQEVQDLGYGTWFHPSASVQRAADEGASPTAHGAPGIILPGDLVHIDFGIMYLGLHTDQQQHAYVLRHGETAAPEGLQRGLAAGNHLQNIVLGSFRTGATGNEILSRSRNEAHQAGLQATIYSHPIGMHGHGAGPTIGLWDQQDGVSGTGDYPLWPNTAYSIELSVLVDVHEWDDQKVRIMLEEDAYFDGESVRFLDGRQTELWLV
ncbi:MAG: M24 family metallopeptidase [bacterium]|nr:M24 family metallopeptidase [bacterium]